MEVTTMPDITEASGGAVALKRARHDHARCVRGALAEATRLCAERGARLTDQRRRVLELVWSSHEPIGAYDILARLADEGRRAQPPVVYRALDFLMAEGLVHRLASLNAYVGCALPARPHVGQFLICRACGIAAEIADARVTRALHASAGRLGFAISKVAIEVAGHCARCAPGAPRP
jgi:Fur family zinc uptake transcriptional regulator